MPGKKKATKGKKKKGKKKGKGKAATLGHDLIFDPPQDLTPAPQQVDLIVRLANPATQYLSFSMKVPVTTRVAVIKERIVRQHQGAINDVKICFNEFKEGNEVKLTSRLNEIGIDTPGEYQVYYDYKAYSHPLLTYSSPVASLDI